MRLIICAECNAGRLFKNEYFQKSLSPYFTLENASLSNGNIEAQKSLLDIFKFNDGDVFVFGGIQQETHKTKDSLQKNLNELTNKVFEKYPNSKIVFWNTIARTDHAYHATQNLAIEIKETFVNNKNVFAYTFRVDDSGYKDTSHFTPESMQICINGITDYIISNLPIILSNNRFENVITPYNTMEFKENKTVTFVCKYPPPKETVSIQCTNFENFESKFDIIVGKNAQGDGRLHLFKHPKLKKITFSDNVVPIHCLVEYY